MQLLTQELQREIPPLYSQENEADPMCRTKFFLPGGQISDPPAASDHPAAAGRVAQSTQPRLWRAVLVGLAVAVAVAGCATLWAVGCSGSAGRPLLWAAF